jgi:DNA helicase II / ATP-dependent DNA helicase PcrA
MPITAQQRQTAQAVQSAAARDTALRVRLVAGPGTGKSFCIEQRVLWLLQQQGVPPDAIAAVSFTRASSADLRSRIQNFCLANQCPAGAQVRVSTLHSLALRALRAAGLLQYPAEPLVLDNWELENIFDAEFGESDDIGKRRREEIRREHEAFWNAGVWGPANYIPPDPPITSAERTAFNVFHGSRTQTYSCVLPGEIVRQCVEAVEANIFDPVQLRGMTHLIVDEYQDLNPVDQRLIRQFVLRGVNTFIAGDDDQSIYSFRYASPAGIQTFVADNAGAGDHTLSACFRCASEIVDCANALMQGFAQPNRIPKQLNALYATAAPPVSGVVHRWRCATAVAEADLIAESCASLVAGGLKASEILILLSNQREQLQLLLGALQSRGVDALPPPSEGFKDSDAGGFIGAILRIVCEPNDYIANRTIFGVRPGVGLKTSNAIAGVVLQNTLNYRDLFYVPNLPAGFAARQVTALNGARSICAQISAWTAQETLAQRTNEIALLVEAAFNTTVAGNFLSYVQTLPTAMTLEELKGWFFSEDADQQMLYLTSVYQRLGTSIPTAALLQPKVRLMSMHGAKGLSARVVFIPGLEDDILPGPWRSPYPSLVLEAARLLYVSITRAMAACIISFPSRRVTQGRSLARAASRFSTSLNGRFDWRSNPLTAAEVRAILTANGNL